jgi:preprotein translocase subunit YajC
MLEAGEENLRSARVSGIALIVTLILVFAVPSFIIFGTRYDLEPMVVIGWALIPVGLIAVIVTAVVQRPDRARRKAAGLRR